MFSSVLEGFRILGQNREFRVGVGSFDGVELGVCSTGIGGPSTEIALVEAAELGCEIALRVGGCGAIEPEVPVGSLLVVSSALRGSGAAALYNSSTEPVCADAGLVRALSGVADELGIHNASVTVASTDSYYAGQGRSYPNAPADVAAKLEEYRRQGAQALDMEAESILAIGKAVGVRSGVLLAVHANRITDLWLEDFAPAQKEMLDVACRALVRLMRETPSRIESA
jgi:uridine phosphorylase